MRSTLLVVLGLCAPVTAGESPVPLAAIPVGTNEPDGRREVRWMAFFPKGDRIAVRTAGPLKEDVQRDSVVQVYEVATGKSPAAVTIPGGDGLAGAGRGLGAVSPGGDWVAYTDGRVKFLAVPPHEPVLPKTGPVRPRTARGVLAGVWLGADGAVYTLYGLGSDDDRYALYQWSPAAGRGEPEPKELAAGGGASFTALAAAFDPAAGRLAVALADVVDGKKYTIECWALGDKPVKVLIKSGVRPMSLAVSPDGKTLAVGFSDGWVGWYAAGTGNLTGRVRLGMMSVACLAFHPKGEVVACGTWDARGASNLFCVHLASAQVTSNVVVNRREGVSGVCFSPDGGRLATFGSAALSVWDTAAVLKW